MINSMFWIVSYLGKVAALMFFTLSKSFVFFVFFAIKNISIQRWRESIYFDLTCKQFSIQFRPVYYYYWSTIQHSPTSNMMMKTFFLEAETSDHGSRFEVEYQIHLSSIMWSYSLKIRPVTIFVSPYQNITDASDAKKKSTYLLFQFFILALYRCCLGLGKGIMGLRLTRYHRKNTWSAL